MKKIFSIILLSIGISVIPSTAQITIDQAEIWADRVMKDIGVRKTTFDSVRLKENITLSMADLLTYNTSIFVKSYGRATLSTISFRGTGASHTQVLWNGMKINSPMLGMTDFSMIPSYFIDDATLLHGSSSVNETGGGLGGAVKLETKPAQNDGFSAQYTQGIGSFYTFDEFLRLTYGTPRLQLSTRVLLSTSPNNFKYRNHDKKVNVYDDDMNIIEQYYPIERNRSGAFRDFHILQEAFYNTGKGDRFSLSAWYLNSRRELPMLTVDHAEETSFENIQREQTFRGVAGWDRHREKWKLALKGGYIYTQLNYDYKRDLGNGFMAPMIESRSTINTLYASAESEYYPTKKWLLTASLSLHQNFVLSKDRNIIKQDGDKAIVGYDRARAEISGSISAKWKPIKRIGISLVIREEVTGNRISPIIPALFIDGLISQKGNITVKASVSRNFRVPTLNDLYFLPGGNPDLKNEKGWTYDAGINFYHSKEKVFSIKGGINWFDSYISDWIIWLPTTKGFFSPDNIKDVHAYGIETNAALQINFTRNWNLDISGTFSWTPSINVGEPRSPADMSVGKQLPYVPEFSSGINGILSWKSWSFQYKWCYYSPRFTMSSNDITLTGRLPEYFMSNISLEKRIPFSWGNLSFKGVINNLFNEEYLSVLSRPMPGINFQLFVTLSINRPDTKKIIKN